MKYVNKELVKEYDEGSERIKDKREISRTDERKPYEASTSMLREIIESRVRHIDEMRQKPRRRERKH